MLEVLAKLIYLLIANLGWIFLILLVIGIIYILLTA